MMMLVTKVLDGSKRTSLNAVVVDGDDLRIFNNAVGDDLQNIEICKCGRF